MDRRRFAEAATVALRKSRSLLDRPLSWLEVRKAKARLRAPLTYRERVVFRELGQFLGGDGLVVYDIGAADGIYTSMFAKVSSIGAVYAFEPVPAAYDALVRRIGRFPHVTAFNFALGDRNERRTLYEYSDSDVSSLLRMEERQTRLLPLSMYPVEREAEVRRLDELLEERVIEPPDLIKMDVQGYEGHVLRGGESALGHARYCVIELSFVSMYRGSWLFKDAYAYLTGRGFDLVGVAGPIAGPLGRAPQIDGVFRRRR